MKFVTTSDKFKLMVVARASYILVVVLAATVQFCVSNPNNTPNSDLKRFKSDWEQSLSALDIDALINTLFDLVQNSGSQAFEVSDISSNDPSPPAHTHTQCKCHYSTARAFISSKIVHNMHGT